MFLDLGLNPRICQCFHIFPTFSKLPAALGKLIPGAGVSQNQCGLITMRVSRLQLEEERESNNLVLHQQSSTDGRGRQEQCHSIPFFNTIHWPVWLLLHAGPLTPGNIQSSGVNAGGKEEKAGKIVSLCTRSNPLFMFVIHCTSVDYFR